MVEVGTLISTSTGGIRTLNAALREIQVRYRLKALRLERGTSGATANRPAVTGTAHGGSTERNAAKLAAGSARPAPTMK